MAENVYAVAERYRRELLAHDRRAASELVRRYGRIWQVLQKRIEKLVREYDAAIKAGETLAPQGWLFQYERAMGLRRQVEREMMQVAEWADARIQAEQRMAIDAAIRHSRALVAETAGMLGVSFVQLPNEAVADLIGFTQAGSPLRALLDGLGVAASEAVQEALITGLATGQGPRETARLVRQALGGNMVRALRISRTETLRAYREATLRSYQANPNVVEQWEWVAAKSVRTCGACLAMDGTLHPMTERLNDHVNGRCVMVPVVRDVPVEKRETGKEWFEKQSPSDQQYILGRGHFEAWKRGEFKFGELVTWRRDSIWGDSVGVKSLRELTGRPAGGVKLPPIAAAVTKVRGPAGTPVSGALALPAGKFGQQLETTLKAIDKVHGDGELKHIPVSITQDRKLRGAYKYWANGAPNCIEISAHGKIPELTCVHEIGHFIRQSAMALRQREIGAEFVAWIQAVDKSDAVRKLVKLSRTKGKFVCEYIGSDGARASALCSIDRRYVDYLLQSDELWARSYAQWIATRSGDRVLLEQLARERAEVPTGALVYPSQWADEDFEPIGRAMDAIFMALGWIV